jgi:glycine dehydrogenase
MQTGTRNNPLAHPDRFVTRHLGPQEHELQSMLEKVGVSSLDELMNEAIPDAIRLENELVTGEPMSEAAYLRELKEKAALNKVYRSYIGLGYHDTVTPSVILRNVFENPGWYTQYTPYQAEIAQGRLEALLNFQTMISDLTAMPIANASLLDEGTAAAEAVSMTYGLFHKKNRKSKANTVLVSSACFPQTIDVVQTRAEAVGIEVKIVDAGEEANHINEDVFAVLIQYPETNGNIGNHRALAEAIHSAKGYLIVAADLLSLALLEAPGEFGADVVLGNSQRFGVPLGFGGPHAAYFAATEDFLRLMPGRIIGVSQDRFGKPALRMALQTREQHIRRDKATSNICTAQALLAIMASMYAVYHGPDGIYKIAKRIQNLTSELSAGVKGLGIRQINDSWFDTLHLEFDDAAHVARLRELCEDFQINLRFINEKEISISLNEATEAHDAMNILSLLASATGQSIMAVDFGSYVEGAASGIPQKQGRITDFLTHPVFNSHRSETAMMRYIKSLENKDLSLNTAMIPLGSCTMKLNAATELIPVSWPEFGKMHPFAPSSQTKGYQIIIEELRQILCKVTGFHDMSFQPNSGAQGEYTGLMVIRAYHHSRGDQHRNIALIPDSAHGTNPASAVMAAMKVVVVKTDELGNIDMDDLKAKAEKHAENLACLMVTYPSTYGVFESGIREICQTIHDNGGQVYMDGANMNAQVGLTSPGFIGADVCHLNLHKTFAIPHGGGGPGMGPIGVVEHLAPFLPGHELVETGGDQAISAVSAAPFGSPSILLISYAYCKMLGHEGMTEATRYAILNANYMKDRLKNHYKVLFSNERGRVAHEFILDLREFKKVGVEVDDITKRLIDYGFHAPTVSWPVASTIMIEPTESEPLSELDRFCDAMISIRKEIEQIENGSVAAQDTALAWSPHTVEEITATAWTHVYSREEAAFPDKRLYAAKFWPAVKRVDNTYGDRNIVCTCPPIGEYETV